MGVLGVLALVAVLCFSSSIQAEEGQSYAGVTVGGIHFVHTDKKPFPNRTMRSKMSTRPGAAFEHHIFDDDIAALKKDYQNANFLQVQISSELHLDDAGQLDITLSIASGKKINTQVKDIHFVHLGKKYFTNQQLRATMKTQEAAPFERRFFRGDLASIENLYRGEGYMGVDVVRQNLTLLKNLNRLYRGEALESLDKLKLQQDGLDLTIEINPGPRWTLAQVNLELEGTFDQAQLRRQLDFAAGSPFLYREILAGERTLQSYLLEAGYAQAQVNNQVDLDPDNGSATITYRVAPGPRLYFGEISFIGAPTNKALLSRESLLRRYITIEPGTIYNPEAMRNTRTKLASTGLFRSVTLRRPALAPGDTVQPVEIVLQERKYISLQGDISINTIDAGVAANAQHSNWLGRGTRLGLDTYLGRPLQGGTMYISERNIFDSGLDLTFSAGLIQEWSETQIGANSNDEDQRQRLIANDSVLSGLVVLEDLVGTDTIDEYITGTSYLFNSVERLWTFNSVLGKTWYGNQPSGRDDRGTVYQIDFSVAWAQSRTTPQGKKVDYLPPEPEDIDTSGNGGDDPFGDDPFGDGGDDPFGDDPFGDGGDDPFGDGGDDPFADNTDSTPPATDDGTSNDSFFDYTEDDIPLDDFWRDELTLESRTLNFTAGFQRDTRNDQIAPSRGTFLQLRGLYAIEFGRRATRVLDGDMEARAYVRLWGERVVWAQALRVVKVASLRADRVLPRTYWKEFGGEGSVRGVERESINIANGGRLGLNLRNELRFQRGPIGLVFFWDRAGVWEKDGQASWGTMVGGFGLGLRYVAGIPLRLDFGWPGDFDFNAVGDTSTKIYFSIGQAF